MEYKYTGRCPKCGSIEKTKPVETNGGQCNRVTCLNCGETTEYYMYQPSQFINKAAGGAVTVRYYLSCDNWGDGKSVCLWRSIWVSDVKIARFQSDGAARLFAEDFQFPLADNV